jgi:uncharacterized damage-inducible protein DinB
MPSALVEMFRHNLWANLRLLDACAALSEDQLGATAPGTYGSVRDTLVHVAGSEARYVAVLSGQDPQQAGEEMAWENEPFPGVEDLRERVRRSSEALVSFVQGHDPEQVLRGDFRGQTYEMSVSVPLLQAINHATEHRAHVMTVLSQCGVEPPVLDGWTYWRTGGRP